RVPLPATKAPSSRLTGFARATSLAPRNLNHLNDLGSGARANAMRVNPLLIQANARTPTQFTHVFAMRARVHTNVTRSKVPFCFRQLDTMPNGSSTAFCSPRTQG